MISYIKFKGVFFAYELTKFYVIFICSTLVSSIILGKFSVKLSEEFIPLSKITVKAFVLNVGIITLIVNFYGGFTTSRLLIVGSLTLGLLLEFIYIVYNSKFTHQSSDKNIFSFSVIFIIIEFIILTWLTFYSLFTYDLPDYSSKQKILFVIVLYTIWFLSSSINRHSDVSKGTSLSRVVWNHLTSYVVLFLIVSSLVFLLGLPIEVKKLAIYNILIFSVWSFLAVILYYLYSGSPKTDNVSFGIFNTTEFPEDFYEDEADESENAKQSINTFERVNLLKDQLKNIYLKKFPNVNTFLNKNMELKNYDISECVILRSADTYNIEVIPNNSISLYMNLHELNDIRRINEYMIDINKRLKQNGYFVGRFESNSLRFQTFHKKYPFYLANFLYSIDFVWKRVFPKLPIIKKIFFFISNGKSRALSMAEGLGRLYYCGFKVKAIQEIDDYLYFIARRDREPSTDKNPSYGLFFKMKRVGQFGKPIFVYKMRTMHPYSEYLQKFVHDNFSLKEGGKFENDFRITSWGKIARKLWIDELPMLINWIKRDLKLVGIRPLSYHYISLYAPEFVKFRNNFKPGLVPPFYVDMPKTLDEIQKSERTYLEKYLKHKYLIDVEYLFKSFYNIFYKKARSS